MADEVYDEAEAAAVETMFLRHGIRIDPNMPIPGSIDVSEWFDVVQVAIITARRKRR